MPRESDDLRGSSARRAITIAPRATPSHTTVLLTAAGRNVMGIATGRWAKAADERGRELERNQRREGGTHGLPIRSLRGNVPKIRGYHPLDRPAEPVHGAVRWQLAVAAARDRVSAVHDAPVRRDVDARGRPERL